jgi:hypothetical protein
MDYFKNYLIGYLKKPETQFQKLFQTNAPAFSSLSLPLRAYGVTCENSPQNISINIRSVARNKYQIRDNS